jgi:hypothetical protein
MLFIFKDGGGLHSDIDAFCHPSQHFFLGWGDISRVLFFCESEEKANVGGYSEHY